MNHSRTGDAVQEVASALRLVGEREVHHAVFRPESSSPYFVQFTTDPGVFWGEVVSDDFLEGTRRLGTHGARRLEALGWRAPDDHIPNWFQYFHPTRKRHYRQLAEHVLATFHRGLGLRGPVVVASIDRSSAASGPTFVPDHQTISGADRDLLDMAVAVLAGFEPDFYDTHIELTMRRRRHRVRIAVSACDGTLSCMALHLPAAMPEVADAAFAISDELDRVPYTYALRTVAGHGESLVLLSKVAVMPDQRTPPVVGMLLYTTIEPLVAAHRALHSQAAVGGSHCDNE
jgi:hypothetical protein